jgi:hypothetical protein
LAGNEGVKTKNAFGAIAWKAASRVCRTSAPNLSACLPRITERESLIS